jgi:ketosteroid isomerase-like protein
MKPLLVLLAIAMLSIGTAACDEASKHAATISQASPDTKMSGGAPTTTVSSTAQMPRGLKGDEDDDDNGENVGNTKNDNDADFDNDYKNENKGYYDSDDNSSRLYGHAARIREKQVLTAVVKHYFAAASAGDGATACSLFKSNYGKAIPEDYGQAPGPAYMRGKTCAAVMSLLFKHLHARFADSAEVTDVRVDGNRALVLLGSKTVPASYVTLERQHSVWGIVGLLSTTLP